jgi:hypothetical protein
VKGLIAAWAVGLGVLTWQELRQARRPVPPGRYLAASGVFALLGLLASYQPAAGAAAAAGWGLDLAVLLKPGILPGSGGQPVAATDLAATATTTTTTGA